MKTNIFESEVFIVMSVFLFSKLFKLPSGKPCLNLFTVDKKLTLESKLVIMTVKQFLTSDG